MSENNSRKGQLVVIQSNSETKINELYNELYGVIFSSKYNNLNCVTICGIIDKLKLDYMMETWYGDE